MLLQQLLASGPQGSSPQLAVRRKARNEHVELIALRIRQVAIVHEPLYLRFEPGPGFEWRSFCGTVKEDIELDLKPANVVFKFPELLIQSGRFFKTAWRLSIKVIRFWRHLLV